MALNVPLLPATHLPISEPGVLQIDWAAGTPAVGLPIFQGVTDLFSPNAVKRSIVTGRALSCCGLRFC
jgi:hypothetical protein